MSKWLRGKEIRHQVAIAGQVTDAETGEPIRGARVSLRCGPATFTAADGLFHFLDLTAGKYTLKASLTGAGTRYGQSGEVTVTVKWDEPGKFAIANLALPPLTGQAKEPAPPAQAGGKQSPSAASAATEQSLTRQKKKQSKSQSPQQPKPAPAAGSKRPAGKLAGKIDLVRDVKRTLW